MVINRMNAVPIGSTQARAVASQAIAKRLATRPSTTPRINPMTILV